MAKTVGLTFNEKPITIEPPADYRENENVIDYKSMTVPELKAYAAELGIDRRIVLADAAVLLEVADHLVVHGEVLHLHAVGEHHANPSRQLAS